MEKVTVEIDFESSIGPWLGRTVKLVDYHMQEAFIANGLDLTKEQMVVLKKLHNEDGLNQNELAFLTYRDKSSLARLLSKMEKKQYIRRKQSPKDKRVNYIYLTDLGRELFTRTRPVIKAMITVMEDGMLPAEKDLMIKILKKIQFNFTKTTNSI